MPPEGVSMAAWKQEVATWTRFEAALFRRFPDDCINFIRIVHEMERPTRNQIRKALAAFEVSYA